MSIQKKVKKMRMTDKFLSDDNKFLIEPYCYISGLYILEYCEKGFKKDFTANGEVTILECDSFDECLRMYKKKSNMRPSWQDMFFEIAETVSKRSKDPHTKVGAVLVKDNHIIGIGYNGEPKEFRYDFNWNSNEKYDYVIHAEMNAISNANYIGVNCSGADIYVTHSPCNHCILLLIQHGIKNIYFKKRYKDYELTKKIADNSNINLIEIGEN